MSDYFVGVVTCPIPQAPLHGRVVTPQKLVVDSIIFYNCDTGYVIEGQTASEVTATCLSDGQWSAQPPICGESIVN